MADFNALEALINAHIKKNGVQAITGNILNGILRGMVSALGKGYTIAGVAVPSSDPGTMTGPLAYLAYTAGTYTHFGGLEVEQGEVAMLIYNEAEWHKEVLFSLSATATIDGNVGTPEVGVSFVDGLLTFDFRNMKGNTGDAAGFGTISATVDGNVGTPGVSVQSSGPDTAKNITFQFTNLKGETGVTSVVATVDNTVGTPTCTVSLVGQQLTLAFSGLKGAQGDTGSSVDYPFTIVNNLTTNDATQALSAAMGVQLEAEVSQLEAKVGEPEDAFQTLPIQMTLGYFDVTGASVASSPTTTTRYWYCEIPVKPGEQFKVYGYGGTTQRLWCFIDGSRNVLSVADDSVDARTTPAELTAPASSAILIYQAMGYDVSRDKVEKYLPVKISKTLDGTTETDWSSTAQSLTANKYYNTNNSTMPTGTSSSTGTYCAKIAVVPGEIYRITGVGDGASLRLWATAGSDYARKRYSSTNVDGRSCPYVVYIAADEAYLYVNLNTYDSTTDKIEKLTSASSHEKGLIERVSDLENNPVTTVVDALDSTSTTDALSANQGRVLNEDINGTTTPTYTDQPLQADKYFNTSNSRIPTINNLASLEGTYCCRLDVTPGQVYRIYGKGNSGVIQLYALGDAERYVVEGGTPGVALNTRTTPLDLTIPEGVAVLAVNLYQYDSTTDKVQLVGSTTSECVKTRLAALEAKDVEIESYALPLKGKKVMFFGDSITEFTYNGKGSVAYFADYSGATCYKAAVGGTRFVQRTAPVDTPTSATEAYAALDICNMVKAWCEADYTKQDAATTYLNDYTARVTALKDNPVNTIDIVIIGGGTNDITNGSPIGTKADDGFTTLWGVFNKMVELLLTANPALKIYFFSPVVGYRNNERDDANWSDNYEYTGGTRQEFVELFKEMANHSHIPYIDAYNTLGWNQTNFSQYFLDTDGTHPYKGFDVIARRLYGQIKALME